MENISNTSKENCYSYDYAWRKSLEFDSVFFSWVGRGCFPSKRSIEESGKTGLEEERRLAYVALTRARKKFILPM